MKYIYIAGPYGKGDVALNVRKAVEVGEFYRSQGYVPYIPHLTHLWHLISPHDWQYWIDYDLEWLKKCDVLCRIQGESKGADIEVEEAKRLGIKVVEYIYK